MSSNNTFTLVDFSPMGFIEPNYPVKFCSLCRGELNEVCGKCIETNSEKCNVTNCDDSYFHRHCYDMVKEIDIKNKAKKPKPPEYDDSDSDIDIYD